MVSMNTKDRSIDLDNRKLRSHVRDYCGSLIEISEGDRVELVHTTAKKLESHSRLSLRYCTEYANSDPLQVYNVY